MAFFTRSSTSAQLPHDSASSPSVAFDVSQISRRVNFLKNGSVSSITNASSLTIMHAALSSVNFGLNVKPSAEKNSFDALRSRTATSNATLELGWSHCPHCGAAAAEAARHAAHRKSTNTSNRRPRRVGRSGFPEAPDSKWWRAHVSSPDIQSLGEQRLDRRRAEQAKLPHLGLDSGHEELISELNQCPGVDDSAVVAP